MRSISSATMSWTASKTLGFGSRCSNRAVSPCLSYVDCCSAPRSRCRRTARGFLEPIEALAELPYRPSVCGPTQGTKKQREKQTQLARRGLGVCIASVCQTPSTSTCASTPQTSMGARNGSETLEKRTVWISLDASLLLVPSDCRPSPVVQMMPNGKAKGQPVPELSLMETSPPLSPPPFHLCSALLYSALPSSHDSSQVFDKSFRFRFRFRFRSLPRPSHPRVLAQPGRRHKHCAS